MGTHQLWSSSRNPYLHLQEALKGVGGARRGLVRVDDVLRRVK